MIPAGQATSLPESPPELLPPVLCFAGLFFIQPPVPEWEKMVFKKTGIK